MQIQLLNIQRQMNICRRYCGNSVRNWVKMKIVQFKTVDDKVRIGLVDGEKVIDANAADKTIPHSLVELLHRDNASEILKTVAANPVLEHHLSEVQLLSPITKPDKVLGVALNYKGDLDKRNIPYPKEPIVFSKFASVITGAHDPIPKPTASDAVDWEVELVVVIGKKAHQVKAEQALDYVFGYTATQDITAKDWTSRNGGQFVMCKNMEGFCPLGPCLITKEELGDPYNIRLRTWVNGELKQDGNTGDMIYNIESIIEYLSSAMTLLPGDIICTGTPYGTGSCSDPPQYLKPGDLLESEVEKIGRMANRIVAK